MTLYANLDTDAIDRTESLLIHTDERVRWQALEIREYLQARDKFQDGPGLHEPSAPSLRNRIGTLRANARCLICRLHALLEVSQTDFAE